MVAFTNLNKETVRKADKKFWSCLGAIQSTVFQDIYMQFW